MATYTYPGGPATLTLPGAESDTINGDGTTANSSVTVSFTGGSENLTVNSAYVTLSQTGGNDTVTLNSSLLFLLQAQVLIMLSLERAPMVFNSLPLITATLG